MKELSFERMEEIEGGRCWFMVDFNCGMGGAINGAILGGAIGGPVGFITGMVVGTLIGMGCSAGERIG